MTIADRIAARSTPSSPKPTYTGEWVWVTPLNAQEWLDNHNHYNRKLSKARATSYSRDMKSGAWLATPEGLAFNCDGTLIDGQTRLAAVILSGVSSWFWVFTGVPKAVANVIDSGTSRTPSDTVAIVNRETVIPRDFAIAPVIENRGRTVKCYGSRTRSEKIALYKKYEATIIKATAMFAGSPHRIAAAPVVGVICRALLAGRPKTKLAYFAEVLANGMPRSTKDSCIVRLRDALLSPTKRTTERQRAFVYEATAYILHEWLSGRNPVRILQASSELFPISGES